MSKKNPPLVLWHPRVHKEIETLNKSLPKPTHVPLYIRIK